MGNILTVKLLQANPDCDWLVAEIVNAQVVAAQSGGMLRELAGELMRGSTSEDFSKRIPGVMGHLAPLAAKWTAANTDLFVERFFEKAFFSEKDRAIALAKSNEKRSLAEMVLALGHDTPKVQQLASWIRPPAEAAPLTTPTPEPEAPLPEPTPAPVLEAPLPEPPPPPEPPPAPEQSPAPEPPPLPAQRRASRAPRRRAVRSRRPRRRRAPSSRTSTSSCW